MRWNVPVDEAGLNAVYEASVEEVMEFDERMEGMDDGEGGGWEEGGRDYWVDGERARRVVEKGMATLRRK